MSPLNKACLIIGILIALASLCLYIKASADDGSGCDAYSPSGVNCYMPQLFKQNEILIQEQNQTNHLLAYQYCETHFQGHIDGWGGFQQTYNPTGIIYNTLDNCTKSIMGMTK